MSFDLHIKQLLTIEIKAVFFSLETALALQRKPRKDSVEIIGFCVSFSTEI